MRKTEVRENALGSGATSRLFPCQQRAPEHAFSYARTRRVKSVTPRHTELESVMPRPKQELMQRKAPVEFTPERKKLFLEKFRETGFQVISAEFAGVTSKTVQQHKDRDPEFAEEYRQALDFHTENVIERALIKRGIEGVEKPIIGGQFRDEVVAKVREYSDPCLLALARSRKTEYNKGAGEDGPGGGGGSGGGVLVVPSAPHSIMDWQALYGEKARGTTGKPSQS